MAQVPLSNSDARPLAPYQQYPTNAYNSGYGDCTQVPVSVPQVGNDPTSPYVAVVPVMVPQGSPDFQLSVSVVADENGLLQIQPHTLEGYQHQQLGYWEPGPNDQQASRWTPHEAPALPAPPPTNKSHTPKRHTARTSSKHSPAASSPATHYTRSPNESNGLSEVPTTPQHFSFSSASSPTPQRGAGHHMIVPIKPPAKDSLSDSQSTHTGVTFTNSMTTGSPLPHHCTPPPPYFLTPQPPHSTPDGIYTTAPTTTTDYFTPTPPQITYFSSTNNNTPPPPVTYSSTISESTPQPIRSTIPPPYYVEDFYGEGYGGDHVVQSPRPMTSYQQGQPPPSLPPLPPSKHANGSTPTYEEHSETSASLPYLPAYGYAGQSHSPNSGGVESNEVLSSRTPVTASPRYQQTPWLMVPPGNVHPPEMQPNSGATFQSLGPSQRKTVTSGVASFAPSKPQQQPPPPTTSSVGGGSAGLEEASSPSSPRPTPATPQFQAYAKPTINVNNQSMLMNLDTVNNKSPKARASTLPSDITSEASTGLLPLDDDDDVCCPPLPAAHMLPGTFVVPLDEANGSTQVATSGRPMTHGDVGGSGGGGGEGTGHATDHSTPTAIFYPSRSSQSQMPNSTPVDTIMTTASSLTSSMPRYSPINEAGYGSSPTNPHHSSSSDMGLGQSPIITDQALPLRAVIDESPPQPTHSISNHYKKHTPHSTDEEREHPGKPVFVGTETKLQSARTENLSMFQQRMPIRVTPVVVKQPQQQHDRYVPSSVPDSSEGSTPKVVPLSPTTIESSGTVQYITQPIVAEDIVYRPSTLPSSEEDYQDDVSGDETTETTISSRSVIHTAFATLVMQRHPSPLTLSSEQSVTHSCKATQPMRGENGDEYTDSTHTVDVIAPFKAALAQLNAPIHKLISSIPSGTTSQVSEAGSLVVSSDTETVETRRHYYFKAPRPASLPDSETTAATFPDLPADSSQPFNSNSTSTNPNHPTHIPAHPPMTKVPPPPAISNHERPPVFQNHNAERAQEQEKELQLKKKQKQKEMMASPDRAVSRIHGIELFTDTSSDVDVIGIGNYSTPSAAEESEPDNHPFSTVQSKGYDSAPNGYRSGDASIPTPRSACEGDPQQPTRRKYSIPAGAGGNVESCDEIPHQQEMSQIISPNYNRCTLPPLHPLTENVDTNGLPPPHMDVGMMSTDNETSNSSAPDCEIIRHSPELNDPIIPHSYIPMKRSHPLVPPLELPNQPLLREFPYSPRRSHDISASLSRTSSTWEESQQQPTVHTPTTSTVTRTPNKPPLSHPTMRQATLLDQSGSSSYGSPNEERGVAMDSCDESTSIISHRADTDSHSSTSYTDSEQRTYAEPDSETGNSQYMDASQPDGTDDAVHNIQHPPARGSGGHRMAHRGAAHPMYPQYSKQAVIDLDQPLECQQEAFHRRPQSDGLPSDPTETSVASSVQAPTTPPTSGTHPKDMQDINHALVCCNGSQSGLLNESSASQSTSAYQDISRSGHSSSRTGESSDDTIIREHMQEGRTVVTWAAAKQPQQHVQQPNDSHLTPANPQQGQGWRPRLLQFHPWNSPPSLSLEDSEREVLDLELQCASDMQQMDAPIDYQIVVGTGATAVPQEVSLTATTDEEPPQQARIPGRRLSAPVHVSDHQNGGREAGARGLLQRPTPFALGPRSYTLSLVSSQASTPKLGSRSPSNSTDISSPPGHAITAYIPGADIVRELSLPEDSGTSNDEGAPNGQPWYSQEQPTNTLQPVSGQQWNIIPSSPFYHPAGWDDGSLPNSAHSGHPYMLPVIPLDQFAATTKPTKYDSSSNSAAAGPTTGSSRTTKTGGSTNASTTKPPTWEPVRRHSAPSRNNWGHKGFPPKSPERTRKYVPSPAIVKYQDRELIYFRPPGAPPSSSMQTTEYGSWYIPTSSFLGTSHGIPSTPGSAPSTTDAIRPPMTGSPTSIATNAPSDDAVGEDAPKFVKKKPLTNNNAKQQATVARLPLPSPSLPDDDSTLQNTIQGEGDMTDFDNSIDDDEGRDPEEIQDNLKKATQQTVAYIHAKCPSPSLQSETTQSSIPPSNALQRDRALFEFTEAYTPTPPPQAVPVGGCSPTPTESLNSADLSDVASTVVGNIGAYNQAQHNEEGEGYSSTPSPKPARPTSTKVDVLKREGDETDGRLSEVEVASIPSSAYDTTASSEHASLEEEEHLDKSYLTSPSHTTHSRTIISPDLVYGTSASASPTSIGNSPYPCTIVPPQHLHRTSSSETQPTGTGTSNSEGETITPPPPQPYVRAKDRTTIPTPSEVETPPPPYNTSYNHHNHNSPSPTPADATSQQTKVQTRDASTTPTPPAGTAHKNLTGAEFSEAECSSDTTSITVGARTGTDSGSKKNKVTEKPGHHESGGEGGASEGPSFKKRLPTYSTPAGYTSTGSSEFTKRKKLSKKGSPSKDTTDSNKPTTQDTSACVDPPPPVHPVGPNVIKDAHHTATSRPADDSCGAPPKTETPTGMSSMYGLGRLPPHANPYSPSTLDSGGETEPDEGPVPVYIQGLTTKTAQAAANGSPPQSPNKKRKKDPLSLSLIENKPVFTKMHKEKEGKKKKKKKGKDNSLADPLETPPHSPTTHAPSTMGNYSVRNTENPTMQTDDREPSILSALPTSTKSGPAADTSDKQHRVTHQLQNINVERTGEKTMKVRMTLTTNVHIDNTMNPAVDTNDGSGLEDAMRPPTKDYVASMPQQQAEQNIGPITDHTPRPGYVHLPSGIDHTSTDIPQQAHHKPPMVPPNGSATPRTHTTTTGLAAETTVDPIGTYHKPYVPPLKIPLNPAPTSPLSINLQPSQLDSATTQSSYWPTAMSPRSARSHGGQQPQHTNGSCAAVLPLPSLRGNERVSSPLHRTPPPPLSVTTATPTTLAPPTLNRHSTPQSRLTREDVGTRAQPITPPQHNNRVLHSTPSSNSHSHNMHSTHSPQPGCGYTGNNTSLLGGTGMIHASPMTALPSLNPKSDLSAVSLSDVSVRPSKRRVAAEPHTALQPDRHPSRTPTPTTTTYRSDSTPVSEHTHHGMPNSHHHPKRAAGSERSPTPHTPPPLTPTPLQSSYTKSNNSSPSPAPLPTTRGPR